MSEATKSPVLPKQKKKSDACKSETLSGQRRAPLPTILGMQNRFDFSAMSGLLNEDPSIKELADQITKDPSFTQTANQLRNTFRGLAVGEGMPQRFYSTMQQIMQNPQLMNIAERLHSTLIQNPGVIEKLIDPAIKDQLDEREARLEEDLSMKHVLDEFAKGGPAAMMRYSNDKNVLKKFGEAMGFSLGGESLITDDDETEEVNEENEDAYRSRLN